MKKPAKLRVCASCEWIFKLKHTTNCPRCNWPSYGAYSVFGNAAYRYAKSQKPWIDRKLNILETRLKIKAEEIICCHVFNETQQYHESDCHVEKFRKNVLEI